jgi:Zn-dependent protease with chaperone function
VAACALVDARGPEHLAVPYPWSVAWDPISVGRQPGVSLSSKWLWNGSNLRLAVVAGAALLVISLAVMPWLARAKRALARTLGSEALQADAFQTTACWWLSLAALAGVGLLGWWWADPVSALVIAGLIVKEAREAWSGRECC